MVPYYLLDFHVMHVPLVGGWADLMAPQEQVALDPSSPALDTMWRQDMFFILFVTRLGITILWAGSNITGNPAIWSYEVQEVGLVSFSLLLFFGHIWYGLFKDVFDGIDPCLGAEECSKRKKQAWKL
ncbi:hypothetical protein SADUNF_Sadunf05G0146700 [Salix dunnii]|uniref:Uncharacterized protein n=1 Tax=Salix dunnii TaxID=1413687 RepID=A0A835MXR9_9ROSI|nr:hypothetical protein SADUNF_Sadunf05G0146700 [Salix dunnii]